MRILYLSPRQCIPTDSGAKLRDYHLARALAEESDLTYVHFADPTGPALELPFCRRVISVPRPPRYTVLKMARGMISRWPLPILNYTSREMIEAVRGPLRAGPFDLIHIDGIQLAACAASLRAESGSARFVFDWHNIESELMARYSESVGSWPRRIYARRTAALLRHVEDSILKSAYGHLVCSQREMEALKRRAPDARVAVIENGVDTSVSSSGAASPDRRSLVFVGSMSYSANVDGAVWFARSLWPTVRRKYSDMRLTIVGADPTAQVLALRELPGIEVTGTVPSVLPYYRNAFAAVVPLRVGGGTRLKILEAMAANVPVISTTLGAEGLQTEPGENILIADDAAEWLVALESLESSAYRERLSRAARGLVCSRYDWKNVGKSMAQLYREWAATGER